MLLIGMQFDMELQLNFIRQHRSYLGKMSSGLLDMKVEYEPGTAPDRQLQAKISRLTEAEKALEMRANDLESRLKAMKEEREGLTKTIGENVSRSFKNNYG